MPINVSEALDTDTAEVITVIRDGGAGNYDDGVYVKGGTTTFKTLASVQQPTPRQLETLPEGERDKNPRMFISKKPLKTTSDRDGTIADIVIYKGDRFKLIDSGDWSAYGHTIAFGVREQ